MTDERKMKRERQLWQSVYAERGASGREACLAAWSRPPLFCTAQLSCSRSVWRFQDLVWRTIETGLHLRHLGGVASLGGRAELLGLLACTPNSCK